ncbi:MAG: hypothetical protein GYB35_00710 [Algicola sp.]|nr:hypothetical protein [Algicola sp.]
MTKVLEQLKEPLTKRMPILTLLAFFGFQTIGKIIVDVFDVNKTMGWKWSVLHTWIDNIPVLSTLIFFGIYLLLNFLNIKTNLILSAIHFLLIALSSLLYNFWELDLRITLSIICFSYIVFGLNLYYAFSNKKIVK